jgi:hypothetical protein
MKAQRIDIRTHAARTCQYTAERPPNDPPHAKCKERFVNVGVDHPYHRNDQEAHSGISNNRLPARHIADRNTRLSRNMLPPTRSRCAPHPTAGLTPPLLL